MSRSTCIALGCIFFLLGCEPEPDVSARAYYVQAKHYYYDEDEPRRAAIAAERAYERGYACATGLLAEIYNPGRIMSTGSDGRTWSTASRWAGQDRTRARKWSRLYVEMIHEKATGGNKSAMLWLANIYRGMSFPGVRFIEGNDSLSVHWLNQAIQAGEPDALLWKAMDLTSVGRKEEAIALYKQAAEAGDVMGYSLWSWAYINEDPVRTYEIAAEAIDRRIPGLEGWFGKQLDTLDEQASNGNAEALTYLAIIDSLDLRNRYEAIKDSIPPEDNTHPLERFCD